MRRELRSPRRRADARTPRRSGTSVLRERMSSATGFPVTIRLAPDAEHVVLDLERTAEQPPALAERGDASRRRRHRRSRRSPSTRRAAPPSCRRSSPRTRRATRRSRVSRSRCPRTGPRTARRTRRPGARAACEHAIGRHANVGHSPAAVRWASTNMPSPALIACGTPATRQSVCATVARVAAVLDVVVDQREVVDQFDRRRGRHRARGVAADGLAADEAAAPAEASSRQCASIARPAASSQPRWYRISPMCSTPGRSSAARIASTTSPR